MLEDGTVGMGEVTEGLHGAVAEVNNTKPADRNKPCHGCPLTDPHDPQQQTINRAGASLVDRALRPAAPC